MLCRGFLEDVSVESSGQARENKVTDLGISKNVYSLFLYVCMIMYTFRGHIATSENGFFLPCGSQVIMFVNTYLTGLKLLELAKFVASPG